MTRDDERIYIFNDRISTIGMYYFKEGEAPVKMSRFSLEIELPESVRVRSAVVVEGWLEKDKVRTFNLTPAAKAGYMKFQIPLPQNDLNTSFDITGACGSSHRQRTNCGCGMACRCTRLTLHNSFSDSTGM